MSDYKVTVTSHPFGTTRSGEPVERWILSNGSMEAAVLTYGATLQQLSVPDRHGVVRDVVLGYDTLKEYEDNTCYFGATVGRCANRIGGGQFLLNGQRFTLAQNNGSNCLHGGIVGFDKKVWKAEITYHGVRFSLVSPDGEEGFPGRLTVTVDYQLLCDNSLSIHYTAISDRDTICNLTNHSYFNLNGHGEGNVLDQQLLLESDFFTPLNGDFVPDGQVLTVDRTPFDFRSYQPIGSRIDGDHPQLRQAGGFDHNFVVRPAISASAPSSDRGDTATDGSIGTAAFALSLESGIRMETLTTMPGVQLYTPDYPVGGMTGKSGKPYEGRCAFCLETQYFPNAMAYGHFAKPILRAGDVYDHRTVYRFSTV